MAQPTSGPWTVNVPFEGHVAAGERLICSAMGHYDGKEETRAENMANARLIAAAPELLDVLKECADVLDKYSDVTDGADGQPRANAAMSMLHDVNAAIRKAEGA